MFRKRKINRYAKKKGSSISFTDPDLEYHNELIRNLFEHLQTFISVAKVMNKEGQAFIRRKTKLNSPRLILRVVEPMEEYLENLFFKTINLFFIGADLSTFPKTFGIKAATHFE